MKEIKEDCCVKTFSDIISEEKLEDWAAHVERDEAENEGEQAIGKDPLDRWSSPGNIAATEENRVRIIHGNDKLSPATKVIIFYEEIEDTDHMLIKEEKGAEKSEKE